MGYTEQGRDGGQGQKADVRNKKGLTREYALFSVTVSSSDKTKSLALAGL